MKQEMTIHEALSELKTIDARIYKKGAEFRACVANKHSNTKIGGVPIEDFVADNKEKYQSVRDLINRRIAIKKAVVLSNANTMVRIGDNEYTVAEAIEMKRSGIDLYKTVLQRIQSQYSDASMRCDQQNRDLEDKANAYAIQMYGDGDKKNISNENVKKAHDSFVEANVFETVETIDCKKEMKELEGIVNTFLNEVDAALSVSNAITKIEI